MQRSQGRLFPLGVFRLLLELRRAGDLSADGMGILPEFQGRGGNALLYAEMAATVKDNGYRS